MPSVDSGGVRIHFETEGSGPALVLHTGAGGDLEIWRHAGYPGRLSGFRKILIDQRGRGRSDRPDSVEAHRLDHFARDVARVLDEVGEQAAAFWGYSNGILVGVAFGAMYPQRLRCLVGTGSVRYRDLSDLPAPDAEEEIRQDVASGGVRAELDRRMALEHDRFPDPIDANVRAGDPRMHALDGVAWMSWKGPKSAFPRFSAPILFLTGEKEDPDRATEQTVASVPRARVVRLPDVGHLGAFYRSDLAVPIALPFLRAHVG
jgi:pimeloyl-ACP methyl ester carboxylesterase